MHRTLRSLLLATTALIVAALPARAQAPDARPQGGAVVAGQARITQTPARTQVDQASNRAVIEWRGFDIGANHQVDIRQPGAQSWSLQRVTGPDPSAIAGRLTSNGGVAIVNPAGIVFHQSAQVDVAGLIASASDTTNQNFMAGRMAFDGAPRPGARVENRGSITVREQGLAALVGPVAANSGTIRARLGRVAIAGAEAVTLDLAGDGLLSLDVTRQVGTAADGTTALATNSGVIAAEGGHVLLTARAASGLLETLVEAGGSIAAGTITATAPQGGVRVPAGAMLDAALPAGGGRVTVGAADGSRIGAPRGLAARTAVEAGATIRADATQAGAGGTVIVHSAERTRMSGRVSARGAAGGAGGQVEVSSRGAIRLDGRIEVGRGGRVLVDPEEVRIVETPTDASEIAAAVVNKTEGDFTVLAEARIRVLAAVDRSVGPLTLMTSNMLAAPGDGIAIEAPLAVLGDLRLRSAGDIIQAEGARIAAGTLFAESRGGAVRLEAAGNAITALDGGSAAGRFAVVSATRLAVDAPIGAEVIALTSGEAIVLRAPLTAETVQLVALGSEGIAQAASGAGIAASRLLVEAPLGAVRLDGTGNRIGALGDSEASGGLTLRTEAGLRLAGTLNAAGAEVALRADAGDITQETGVSRLIAGRLDLAAPGGAVRLDSPGNAVVRVSGTARDALVLESAAGLTVTGSGLAAPRIALGAGGELAQETDALLVTPLLQARAAGAVVLQDPLNAVGALGASSAEGLFALGTAGTLRIVGLVVAPEVALTAAGSILQDGGAISTGLLRATALTGGIALAGAGNAVDALGVSGAAAGFALTTDGTLAVTGTVDAGGALALRAEGVSVQAALRGDGVTLVAAAGDVVQTDGTIAATTLRAEAAGTVRLDAAGNAIRAVSGRAGPLFRVDTATALAVGDIAAETVALNAGGAITQDATGGGIVTGLLATQAGGAVELGAANAIARLGTVVAPGGLVLRSTTALELTAPLDLPSADLGTGGDLTQGTGATLGAGTLRLDVRGDVRLEAPGNALPRLLHAAATRELLLATDGALALEGTVRSGGLLALAAGGSITQPGGMLVAPVLVARSIGGGVALEAPGNLVGAAGGGAAGAWRLAAAAPGALGVHALIAAPEVALTLAGGLDGAGGALRTAALALDAGGAVLLDGPAHRVAALAGRAASLRLDAGGPLDVTGALASAGELALSADRIGLLAPAQAGGNAILVALTGDVAQAAGGAGLTVAGGLMAYAAGGVALDGAGNEVARLAGGAAGGGFALVTGGALAVGGTVAGETVLLRAAGQVTLDGAGFVAGRAVLVAAPGGIAAGAPSRIDPLDAARLPVLMLDTRAAGLTAIPDFVQPDIPGLPPASQPTQLAQFGPAGSAAAPMAFSVVGGFAPVFLLLDGAPALGAVEAGRLGIVGQGGTAFLVGALGGVGGEQAALNASVSGAAGNYRFNNCPMGVEACGAAPPPIGGGGGSGGGGAGGGGAGGGGAGGGGGEAGGGGGTGGGGEPEGGRPPGVLPPLLPPPVSIVSPLILLVELGQAPGSAAPVTEPGTPAPWSPWPVPWPLGPLPDREE